MSLVLTVLIKFPIAPHFCPIFIPHYCPIGACKGRPTLGFRFFYVWSENFLHGEHKICPQQAFVQCIYRLLFLPLFCTFCGFGNTIYFVIFIYFWFCCSRLISNPASLTREWGYLVSTINIVYVFE